MNQREGISYPFQSFIILKGTKKERLEKKRNGTRMKEKEKVTRNTRIHTFLILRNRRPRDGNHTSTATPATSCSWKLIRQPFWV